MFARGSRAHIVCGNRLAARYTLTVSIDAQGTSSVSATKTFVHPKPRSRASLAPGDPPIQTQAHSPSTARIDFVRRLSRLRGRPGPGRRAWNSPLIAQLEADAVVYSSGLRPHARAALAAFAMPPPTPTAIRLQHHFRPGPSAHLRIQRHDGGCVGWAHHLQLARLQGGEVALVRERSMQHRRHALLQRLVQRQQWVGLPFTNLETRQLDKPSDSGMRPWVHAREREGASTLGFCLVLGLFRARAKQPPGETHRQECWKQNACVIGQHMGEERSEADGSSCGITTVTFYSKTIRNTNHVLYFSAVSKNETPHFGLGRNSFIWETYERSKAVSAAAVPRPPCRARAS